MRVDLASCNMSNEYIKEINQKYSTYCAHQNKTIELQMEALFSTVNCVTGESVSVYYDQDYTEDNPIMNIKGKRSDGTDYEQKINVNSISPDCASYIEMIALTTYMYEQGLTNDAGLGISTNSCTYNDIFIKQDFITPLRQMMKWQLENRNMDGYVYFADKLKLLEHYKGTLPLYKQN